MEHSFGKALLQRWGAQLKKICCRWKSSLIQRVSISCKSVKHVLNMKAAVHIVSPVV